ncbi:MAG: thioesterase family protein [Maritimibacter sp.]|nr:thioesterase family protein [Maritimibacter sp.]
MTAFRFETVIQPDWIDYNGHLRDSNFHLVFSLAVDALQDEVGFDAAYRAQTDCSIYLVESHVFYLREVKVGQRVTVETRLLAVDAKRFHLYMEMFEAGDRVAVGEFMELHVAQKPTPRAAPMPEPIRARLERVRVVDPEALDRRARVIGA